LGTLSDHAGIVCAMISMGKDLNMRVVRYLGRDCTYLLRRGIA
jgi:hypothetical protein